ncbi:Copia protein, partial [Mucuna pruriens]
MKKDSAACYDIESKIFNSRQGTLSITEYYKTLNELWIELDQYQGLNICKVDSIAYTGFIKRGRIFKFLHDLNSESDPIQVQILGKKKLPSLSEVFFIIRSEETRQSVMLDKGNSNTGSAMVTGKGPTKRSTFEGKPFTKSSYGEYCTYCKQSGHTKDTCYKCYGNEKVLKRMGGNKCSTQMWVNQTTSDKENYPKNNSLLLLMEIMFLLRSKKQNVVAQFSVETEFRAMTHGICEILWMKIILDDLKVKYERLIKLFLDNNSAMSIAHNPIQHNRTKHIEIDKHFIKEKLDSGLIVTTQVPTWLKVTNVFTKGLLATKFQELNGKLGMIEIHLPT